MTWLWIAVGLIVAFNVLLLIALVLVEHRDRVVEQARDLTPQRRMTEDELWEVMQDMWRPTRAL